MAAALYRPRASSDGSGLQPTSLPRDLYQIAELIELCFSSRLDDSGRSAIREMKAVAQLGPLLWLLSLFGSTDLGLGRGFVWRVGQRVVGNVSVYQAGKHPWLGRGALIANVAVHPDYRRQGIAHRLMESALALAFRRGAHWVDLQVEADNSTALGLYDDLGFMRYETLNHGQTNGYYASALPVAEGPWQVRPRQPGEVNAEADLIYKRARLGAMAWTRTIERADLGESTLSMLSVLAGSGYKEHLVQPSLVQHGRLDGALWIEVSGWRQTRLTLFLDPSLHAPAARQALLLDALRRPGYEGRTLRVEMDAGDPAVEEVLQAAGFRHMRSLVQMRILAGAA